MALAEKLSELLQKHEKLHNEAREIYERCDKENRLPSKDEDDRIIHIRGTEEKKGGEILELATQISSLRRVLGNEGIGNDPRSGQSLDDMRRSDPLPHEDPANTKNGEHRYSFMNAVYASIPGGGGISGLEKEVSDELIKRTGKRAHTFMMPYHNVNSPVSLTFAEIDRQRRVRDHFHKRTSVFDTGAGAGSIPTILDTDWIELLHNQLVVMAAGATEILDLQGKFAIPRQTQAGTAYWVPESGAVTASNQVIDQVLFAPHTVGAMTDISRRVNELSILQTEVFVKTDLTKDIAIEIDRAALNGSGTSGQPLGIMQNTGITGTRTMSLGTNGGVPTWAGLVELHTIVARSNAAALGEFVYVGNADVEGTLATTAKIGSTFPVFLLDDNSKVYGKRTLFSQQIPSNITKGTANGSLSAIIGGIFNQMILAYWSGIDVLVDPYTGSNTGAVRIVALQDMDIQVRHPEAFAFIVDMISNQTA